MPGACYSNLRFPQGKGGGELVPSHHQSLIKAGSSVSLANAKMKCAQIKFKFGTDEYCLITKPSLHGGQDLSTTEVVRALSWLSFICTPEPGSQSTLPSMDFTQGQECGTSVPFQTDCHAPLLFT